MSDNYNNANFTADAASCATCLYANEDLTILGNVLTPVQDTCEKKPGKNYTVPANVTVYATDRIQISATSASRSPTSLSTTQPSSDSSSSLSKGAIAGIVPGALVAIMLVVGGILALLRLKKNKNKTVDVHKGGEAAPQAMLPPDYHYNAVPESEKDRYSYAAEVPTIHAPVD